MYNTIPSCFIDKLNQISTKENLTENNIIFEALRGYIEKYEANNISFTEQELKDEIWKAVPEYVGFYEASNLGRIRGLDRIINKKDPRTEKEIKFLKHGRLLTPSYHHSGYLQIRLSKNGESKSFGMHQVVAKTFIPNPLNYPMVHHRNDLRVDNKAPNLEWTDNSGNIKAAIASGLINTALGESQGNSIFKNEDILKIRELYTQGVKQAEIARIMNVKKGRINEIVHRKTWKHI